MDLTGLGLHCKDRTESYSILLQCAEALSIVGALKMIYPPPPLFCFEVLQVVVIAINSAADLAAETAQVLCMSM